MRRSGWRSLAGLLLVAIGTLLFVDRVDRIGGHGTAPELLWQWWPLLIVAAGCVSLLRLVPRPWLLLGPLLTVVVGLVLLSFTAGTAERRLAGAWTRHYPVAWPVGVIVAGFWVALAGSEWVTRRPLMHQRTKVVALRGDEIDMGQSLAQALARHGIYVTTVARVRGDRHGRPVPGRPGRGGHPRPEPAQAGGDRPEVARVVVFLATPETESMTGAIVDVNGASCLRT